jgi:hypothetical protein
MISEVVVGVARFTPVVPSPGREGEPLPPVLAGQHAVTVPLTFGPVQVSAL